VLTPAATCLGDADAVDYEEVTKPP
jgi:hypothetical protein